MAKGKNGVYVICPNCGWVNKNKSTRCGRCGASLRKGKRNRKKKGVFLGKRNRKKSLN